MSWVGARKPCGGRDVFGEPAKDECFISLFFNRSLKEEKTVTLNVGDFADGVFADAFHPETRFTVENGQLTVNLLPLKGFLLQNIPPERQYKHEAGILMHPTSLPSKYGVGDFGKEAYKFVDFLAEAG